ncbi:MAG: hypothetical protein PT119_23225 [Aphanizomenon gracile PMC627.10]|nr:hypothetical protein [Aphanizomenon gracile PMC627.10]
MSYEQGISMTKMKKDYSDLIVVSVGTAIGLGLLMIMAFTWPTDSPGERYILFLCGLFGSGLGWLIGIFVSPYTTTERSSFKTYATLAQGFLTGFLVSKVDKVFELVIQDLSNNPAVQEKFLVRASFFASSSIFMAIFTYITRTYWDGVDQKEKLETTQAKKELSNSSPQENNENQTES